MQIRTEFDTFLDKIRPHILDLLRDKGLDPSQTAKCINPDHDDSTASMVCAQAADRDWTVYCMGCGAHYDIFSAYSAMEGKPTCGPDWMKEVVIPLANRYGVDVPHREVTPEERFEQELYYVYETVASALNHDTARMPEDPLGYVDSRNWTPSTLANMDVGVLSYDELCSIVTSDQRKRFGLDRTDVFDLSNLIFVSRNRYGKPVRFFARRPAGTKPKYMSTTSSKLMVDVWRDRGHFYLVDKIERGTSEAILVEGQSDAITLHVGGLRNALGTYGCENFTEAHASSLAMQGITKATFLIDGDEAATKALHKLLAKQFMKESGIAYNVVVTPNRMDPDEYARREGIEKLQHLLSNVKMTAFEFVLMGEKGQKGTPEEICKELVPYIASSKSSVARERMAHDLAEHLQGEVSVQAILSDVRRIDRSVETELLERTRAIVEVTSRLARRNIPEAREILRHGLTQVEEVEKIRSSASGARNKCLARLQANKTLEETKRVGGFSLTPGRLDVLSRLLAGGDWRADKLFVIGAIQNMGKSALLCQLIWEIISDRDNDAVAYLLTVDDKAEVAQRRMMATAIGDPTFTMNMIASPHYYAEELGLSSEYTEFVYGTRESAYSLVTEAIASGRLLIEDQTDGQTLAYAETRVSELRRENPNKNIIFGFDNLHDLLDYEGLPEKERITRITQHAKRIAELYKTLSVATAEYRKQDPWKPGSDEDLAESRKLKFAPALTVHLFSDLNTAGEDGALLVHRHNGELMPRVLANVGKNKITLAKGKQMIFDFYPASSLFISVDPQQALSDEEERKRELAAMRGIEQEDE
jgi:DNA primase catalytic core